MSCENPPESAEAVMPRRRRFHKRGICIKCKIAPGKVVIRHAVYCKDCFLLVVPSKFRQVLDPMINPPGREVPVRGVLKASGNLMIGFSGGLGSSVLLDLVKACYVSPNAITSKGGQKHPRKSGKAWDRILVCYVECCQAYEEAIDRTFDVRSMLEKYQGHFDFVPLRLEDAFLVPEKMGVRMDMSCEDLPISIDKMSDESSVSLLKAHLSSLPTATSHQRTISALIRLILQHTAREHGCSHLLLGTSLTSLSVNLIDAVANGAGYTLGLEMAEDWRSNGGEIVRVIRPLREISMKECAVYFHWRGLSVLGNQRMLLAPTMGKASIGALTKEFIHGLERDYPSTVSTIVRTCDKLVSNTEGDKCIFCERPAQLEAQEWKQRISIRNMNSDKSPSSKNETSSPNTREKSGKARSDFIPRLCYACHTTLTSRSSRGARRTTELGDVIHNVPLPAWVGTNLLRADPVANMKEQIQGFLLDTDTGGSEV